MKSPSSHTPTSNNSLSDHPFIWGNIALLAGVPWLLALSMSGLAVGDPVFPAWFEIFLLGLPAIALVTWVQWQQPVSPFSLWFVTKPTESLSDRERQILTLVKKNQNGWYVTGWIAIALSIMMSAIFCKIYIAAPLAQAIAPFPSGLRLLGIVWAEIFFVLSNIFLQAGISALRIKLTPESELSGLPPFAVEKIKNSFTNVGWRSPQILKFFEQEAIVDATETTEADGSESLEISEIIAEESLIEAVSEAETGELADSEIIENITETKAEIVDEESKIEKTENLDEQIDIVEIIEEDQVEVFLDIADTDSSIEESALFETQATSQLLEEQIEKLVSFLEEQIEELVSDQILEEQGVAEIEVQADLEPVNLIAEPEIDQIIDEAQFEISEISLDVGITHSEDLETVEITIETEIGELVGSETITNITETESEIVVEESKTEETDNLEDDLDIVEITEDEKVEIEPLLDIAELEPVTEVSDPIPDEQDVLEIQVDAIASTIDVDKVLPNIVSSPAKRAVDFLKKPRKISGTHKKNGFGKSVKYDRDNVVAPTVQIIEPESTKTSEQISLTETIIQEYVVELDPISRPEIIEQPASEVLEIEHISTTTIEENLEIANINTQDFDDKDDELDELICFNVYVENILQNYLEEDVEQENIEPTIENQPELEVQTPKQITEEVPSQSDDQATKNPKYLVQEFLVDKFLARLEELNSADKANKPNIQATTSDTSEPNSESDEFADLEALLEEKVINASPPEQVL